MELTPSLAPSLPLCLSLAPVAELLPPGCRGAVGRFLYHCGERAARMLQSDEGKVSALPQAGQCHRRDRVGGLQGEQGQTLIDRRNTQPVIRERLPCFLTEEYKG